MTGLESIPPKETISLPAPRRTEVHLTIYQQPSQKIFRGEYPKRLLGKSVLVLGADNPFVYIADLRYINRAPSLADIFRHYETEHQWPLPTMRGMFDLTIQGDYPTANQRSLSPYLGFVVFQASTHTKMPEALPDSEGAYTFSSASLRSAFPIMDKTTLTVVRESPDLAWQELIDKGLISRAEWSEKGILSTSLLLAVGGSHALEFYLDQSFKYTRDPSSLSPLASLPVIIPAALSEESYTLLQEQCAGQANFTADELFSIMVKMLTPLILQKRLEEMLIGEEPLDIPSVNTHLLNNEFNPHPQFVLEYFRLLPGYINQYLKALPQGLDHIDFFHKQGETVLRLGNRYRREVRFNDTPLAQYIADLTSLVVHLRELNKKAN